MAEPIKVELSLDLDKHIHSRYRQTGEDEYTPEPATVETLIIDKAAAELLAKALHDRPGYDTVAELRTRVGAITTEEIRARVVPLIEEALAAPLRKTNAYGEPFGPETTLRQLVMDEAQAVLSKRDGHGNSLGRPTPLLNELVQTEVQKALRTELTEAIQKARAELVAAVQREGGAVMADTIRRALASR